jgi:hypothetical protein
MANVHNNSQAYGSMLFYKIKIYDNTMFANQYDENTKLLPNTTTCIQRMGTVKDHGV